MASKMFIKLLKDGEGVGWIYFELNENETTNAFINLIQTEGYEITTHHNTSISRHKLDIVNSYLKLKQYVKKINDSTYDIKIDIDIDDDMTFQKLFDLHEHVEHIGERERKNDPLLKNCETLNEVIDDFAQLNKLIHKLEGGLHGSNWITASFGPPVGSPDLKIIPLKYKLLSEATCGYKKNHVYLDYCETGKNMSHIFKQNDVETLQRKMVQPQRNIHPSIFINFTTDMAMDYDEYVKWCQDNNAEELGYDYENPRWWGTWELGKLLKSSFKNLGEMPEYDTLKIKIL